MAELNPLSWWRRFVALPGDSLAKIFMLSFLVAAASASAVAVTAVSLEPRHQADSGAARQGQLREKLAAVPGLTDLLADTDDTLETRIVDLDSGTFADGIDPAALDMETAAADPALSTAPGATDDTAGIARRANFAPVHILRRDGDLRLVVLPVHGTGKQSAIRAYLALEADLDTIAALSVSYGSRGGAAQWQDLWAGKRIAGESGHGIADVTRSTPEISSLVRFWLGARGFGPFIANLRAGAD